ncbi:MAG: KOW motif-containing protein [archaeon]
MSHIMRMAMNKAFPLAKKGPAKYVISSLANSKSIPLLLVIRDLLKIAKTRKEALILLRGGEISVNGIMRSDLRFVVTLFDIVSTKKTAKSYRLVMKTGRFSLEEGKFGNDRICKVIGKKINNKGKMQLNLDNGYNILSTINAKTNDSIIYDFTANKISKHMPLKVGSKVEIIGGKNLGKQAVVKKINVNKVELSVDKSTIEIPAKNILVVG